MSMLTFWLIASGVFLVLELVTASLCAIWFVAGGLVSAVCAALNAPVWLQIFLFFVVSGILFVLLYPRLKRSINSNKQATNADMVIGKTCVVTQRIDNIAGTGIVAVDGKSWTARTLDGEVIEADALVRAEQISGVKLLVSPVAEKAAVQ